LHNNVEATLGYSCSSGVKLNRPQSTISLELIHITYRISLRYGNYAYNSYNRFAGYDGSVSIVRRSDSPIVRPTANPSH